MTTAQQDLVEMRQRLLVAAGAALLAAGLILVMFVLPAEFAVDPLGTGARLGLLDLGIVGQQVDALNEEGEAIGAAEIVVPQDRPFAEENVTFEIGPFEDMEYKYRLDKGEALLYSWTTTGPVNYEFHAEPDGAPRGYAQTYEKVDNRSEASGTLTAPFTGIHGWYWQNTTDQPVTISLKSAGYYNLSHEFRGAEVTNKQF